MILLRKRKQIYCGSSVMTAVFKPTQGCNFYVMPCGKGYVRKRNQHKLEELWDIKVKEIYLLTAHFK